MNKIHQTLETLQIHNMYSTTMHDKDDVIHDEYDTSEHENKTEIETYEDFGEKIHETEESISTEKSQVLTVFNKAIHHEDDSSDDKSVIEIEPPKDNGMNCCLKNTLHINLHILHIIYFMTISKIQK